MANEIRLIDANEIPWCNYDLDGYHSFVGVDKEYVDEMPTIDPENLRPKGRWVHDDHFPSQCSECGMISPGDCELSGFYDSNFCPNCGADMRED